MKATIPIGVPPGVRVMHIERVPNKLDQMSSHDAEENDWMGHWKLWIHRSLSDRLLGTYLALWDNGKIERVTVRENEGDQVDLIKPED